MSSTNKKFYWDSSCFICFLNRDETTRRLICEDVRRFARPWNTRAGAWIS